MQKNAVHTREVAVRLEGSQLIKHGSYLSFGVELLLKRDPKYIKTNPTCQT